MWLQQGCVQFDTRQRVCVLCGYREDVYSLTRQRVCVLCGYREDVYSLTLDRGFVCCVVTGRMCTV